MLLEKGTPSLKGEVEDYRSVLHQRILFPSLVSELRILPIFDKNTFIFHTFKVIGDFFMYSNTHVRATPVF